MHLPLLMLAAEPGATQVAHALRQGLDVRVDIVADRQACTDALRRGEHSILLLEECLTDEETSEVLYEAAGCTSLLEVNLGIADAERIVRQVRSALSRRSRDETRARAAAAGALHNELNASLTGLLLESQLAMRQAGPELAPALRNIVGLAAGLRKQLEVRAGHPGSSGDARSEPCAERPAER